MDFEKAVAEIVSMFPNWDKKHVGVLLTRNGGFVERTIEQMLTLEPPQSGHEMILSSTVDPYSSQNATPNSWSSPLQQQQHQHMQHMQSRPNRSKNSTHRGTRVKLPNDFLRIPGDLKLLIQQSEVSLPTHSLTDEQLARMLQNTEFQQEASTMGFDVYSQQQQGQRGTSGGNNNSNGNSSSEDGSFMKSLSNMTASAKASLSQLASKFKSNDSGNGTSSKNGNASLDSNPRSTSSSSSSYSSSNSQTSASLNTAPSSSSSFSIFGGGSKDKDPNTRYKNASGNETRGLLGDDDDEEMEVIDFDNDNKGGAHNKGQQGGRQTFELSDENESMLSSSNSNNLRR